MFNKPTSALASTLAKEKCWIKLTPDVRATRRKRRQGATTRWWSAPTFGRTLLAAQAAPGRTGGVGPLSAAPVQPQDDRAAFDQPCRQFWRRFCPQTDWTSARRLGESVLLTLTYLLIQVACGSLFVERMTEYQRAARMLAQQPWKVAAVITS